MKCKHEDLNKPECINCFNGLPRLECEADREEIPYKYSAKALDAQIAENMILNGKA